MEQVGEMRKEKVVKHIRYNIICNLLNVQRTFAKIVIKIVFFAFSTHTFVALGISAKSIDKRCYWLVVPHAYPMIVMPTIFWVLSREVLHHKLLYFIFIHFFFALSLSLSLFLSPKCFDADTEIRSRVYAVHSLIHSWIFIPSHLRNLVDDCFYAFLHTFFCVFHFDCLKCLQVIVVAQHQRVEKKKFRFGNNKNNTRQKYRQ